jgi:hypothetical protein
VVLPGDMAYPYGGNGMFDCLRGTHSGRPAKKDERGSLSTEVRLVVIALVATVLAVAFIFAKMESRGWSFEYPTPASSNGP